MTVRITVWPQAALPGTPETQARVQGGVLYVNGRPIGLDEAVLSPQPPVLRARVVKGVWEVDLLWRYNDRTAAPDQPAHPVAFELEEGVVPDPIVRDYT